MALGFFLTGLAAGVAALCAAQDAAARAAARRGDEAATARRSVEQGEG